MAAPSLNGILRTRLALAALACLLTAALVGAAGWHLRPEPDPPYLSGLPEASPTVPTDLGTVATAAEADTQATPLPVAPDDTTTSWSTSLGTTSYTDIMWTPDGPIAVAPRELRRSADGRRLPEVATVYALDAATGALRWQRSIQPAAPVLSEDNTRVISAMTSPDGRYLALALEPQGPYPPLQSIVVLSTSTGEVVRTVETRENLLGLDLTDDALVTQTSATYHPDGGSVSSYPLTSPDAEASSWPSTGWLLSATSQSVVQSATRVREPCTTAFTGKKCSLSSVTLSDPSTGRVLQTYDRVTSILPSGAIERLADDQTAPPPEDPAWITARRELINLDTGATMDITGRRLEVATTPTGRIWLLAPFTVNPDPNASTPVQPPVAWVGADGTVSAEPVEVIQLDDNDEYLTVISRTTMTMSAEG